MLKYYRFHSSIISSVWWCLHGPSFERGDSKQRQHGLTDVVEVELTITPFTHMNPRRPVHEHQVLASNITNITPSLICAPLNIFHFSFIYCLYQECFYNNDDSNNKSRRPLFSSVCLLQYNDLIRCFCTMALLMTFRTSSHFSYFYPFCF